MRILLLIAFWMTAVVASEKKIVCYFGSWAVYRPGNGRFSIDYIDPSLCTHLIYTFVGIQNNDVRVLDPWQDLPDDWGKDGFGRFNALRKQNPQLKTLVAIGGWNEGSVAYSEMAKNPESRGKFVENVVKFVKKWGFNGFDVDWEYPGQRGGSPEDHRNYVVLLKDLRTRFDQEGLLLSAAVAAAESSASISYNIPEISKYLDFINLMTYDFHGKWESVTGLNSPLSSCSSDSEENKKLTVKAAINYWLSQGAPKEKLIVGVPFYGRTFTLSNPSQTGIGAPHRGGGAAGAYTRESGMLGYNEICEDLSKPGWNVRFDEEQRTPYAFKDDQWIGYDDVKSIREKAEYISSLGLGGGMIWSIETDDFLGICGEKYPLLKTLNAVLRNGENLDNETSPPELTSTVEGTEVTGGIGGTTEGSENGGTTHLPGTTEAVGSEDGTETSGTTHATGNEEGTKAPGTTDASGNDDEIESAETTNAPTESGKCENAGAIADPDSCGFFKCMRSSGGGYVKLPFACPQNLCYDPNIGVCNWPSD